MTLRLMEAFEGGKWLGLRGDFTANNARTNLSLRVSMAAGTSPYAFADAAGAASTVIFGVAIRLFSLGNGTGAVYNMFDLRNSAGQIIGTLQFTSAAPNPGFKVRWTRARDGVVLAETPTGVIDAGAYYYVEVKVVIAAAGSVEIRTDEVSRVKVNADTLPASGAAAANTIAQHSVGSSSDIRYDDLYLCDGAGSANNDFLGDIEVHRLLPTGDGDMVVTWVGSDLNTIDNWALVNNFDTTKYVESSLVGSTDRYAFADLPASVANRQVFGVHSWMDSYATVLPRSIAPISRLGTAGAEEEGPTANLTTVTNAGGGIWYGHRMEARPGGGAWTTNDVNASQHGVRLKS